MVNKLKTVIEELDLSILQQFPGNPQVVPKEKMNMMVAAMTERGWYGQMPLVWLCPEDMKHYIISGNHRVQAGIQAGLSNRACEIVIDDRYNWKRASADVMMFNNIHGEPDIELERKLIEELLKDNTDLNLLAQDVGVSQATLDLIIKDIPMDIRPESEYKGHKSTHWWSTGKFMVVIYKTVFYATGEDAFAKVKEFGEYYTALPEDVKDEIGEELLPGILEVLDEVFFLREGKRLLGDVHDKSDTGSSEGERASDSRQSE
jgi:hypothetical protein